jgi:hypothetical protein
MWADVETQLVELLAGQLYPQLLSDPGYRILLFEAGLTGLPGVRTGELVRGQFTVAQNAWYKGKPMQYKVGIPDADQLTPEQRSRLREVARLRARLMTMEVKDLECLVEGGANARLLDAKGSIYRVWDSSARNQTRHWWFSEALKNQAIQESKLKGISPGDWIRDALAVSIDFGKCNRLSRISLEELGGVPIIEAKGLPMPQRTTVHRDRAGKTVGSADPDYWRRLGQSYAGNQTQYFLPYLPPGLIKADAWT